MTECRKRWTGALPPFPGEAVEAIRQAVAEQVFEVCVCFWLFRDLHGRETPEAALLGDYCFGRFSHHLAKLDNVPLTDAFAAYLRADTADGGGSFGAFLDFIGTLDAYL